MPQYAFGFMPVFMSSLNLIFLLLFVAFRGIAQEQKTDSLFVQIARNQAVASYNQAVYKQARVYDGHEYITHDHRIKIHPYYRVDSLQTGTVLYNGIRYEKIRMLYDIVRDELAIQQPDGAYRIRLRNEKITQFSIGAYQFNRIISPSQGGDATGVRTGFYEVLHNGTVKALAHRVKVVHEDITQGSYQADYQQRDRFFIVKDGVYHDVKSKGSLLKLFPDQTGALRKFMRANNLKFNNLQREEAITKLTRYYNEVRSR